ncbi:MAG: PilN domain-containing protein [Chromatiales bacterium]|nr:PilN domain-containing protein [Chromatiales bacterium]
MPRINLLPWREQQRIQRRNQFFAGLGGALAGAALVTFLGYQVMDGRVSHQDQRNELLRSEIASLDLRIAEILELEQKKARLLARMEIIEQLQRSRPEIVHVFDELVRALPDGVYLTSVTQTGRRLEIQGRAESNTRVSAFMRNIDSSDWLTQPDLRVVEVRPATGQSAGGDSGPRMSQFTVIARQVSPHEENGQ